MRIEPNAPHAVLVAAWKTQLEARQREAIR